MFKTNSDQGGIGTVEAILIGLVVGIIVLVGFFVWYHHNAYTTLNIREWNVKLNIEEPDAYYKILGNGEGIMISTRQLDELARTSNNSSCGSTFNAIGVNKNLQETSGGGMVLECARSVKAGQKDIAGTRAVEIKAHIRAALPDNGRRIKK